MKRIILVLLVSALLGFGSWFSYSLIFLPVTSVSDGHGHGPDQGTGEWNRSVAHQTEAHKTKALWVGFGTFIVFSLLGGVLVYRGPV